MKRHLLPTLMTVLLASPALAQVSPVTTYQGSLMDLAGRPLTRAVPMSFRILGVEEGGDPVWEEFHGSVDVVDGLFTVALGTISPLTAELFGGSEGYLEISVDGEPLSPRQRIGSVPQALVAEQAQDVRGRDITPLSVSITGVGKVIDAEGQWVGQPAGLRGPPGNVGSDGPAGPSGAAGPRGDAGPQGAVGPQGVVGPQGERGLPGGAGPPGERGPAGSQGPEGPQGSQGPRGPQGPGLDLDLDSDLDGFADWLEVAVGTDPASDEDQPEDADEDGVADALRGVPGLQGPVGPAGAQGQPGERGEAGPQGVQGSQGLQGPQGEPAGIEGDLRLGDVVPGVTVETREDAIAIPDDNDAGIVGVIVVDEADDHIDRITVDLEVEHERVADLQVVLTSPAGTQVVLHDRGAAPQPLAGNYERELRTAEGVLDDFWAEDPSGVWQLAVKDLIGEEAGRLVSWSLNFDEQWEAGGVFAGNDVEVDGWVRTRSGVEIHHGGDLVMRNAAGQETLRLDGETGRHGIGTHVFDLHGDEIGPLMAVDNNSVMLEWEGTPLTLEYDNELDRWGAKITHCYFESADCTGTCLITESIYDVRYLVGFFNPSRGILRISGPRADLHYRSAWWRDGEECLPQNNSRGLAPTAVVLERESRPMFAGPLSFRLGR